MDCNEKMLADLDYYEDRVRELEEQNKRLRQVLEWYGDKHNYGLQPAGETEIKLHMTYCGMIEPVIVDKGRRAREVLK